MAPARLEGAEAWLPRINRAPKLPLCSPPRAPAPPPVSASGQHECTQCHAQVPACSILVLQGQMTLAHRTCWLCAACCM